MKKKTSKNKQNTNSISAPINVIAEDILTLTINDVPDYVRDIVFLLKNKGFNTWIVGGSVRDIILGREINDWDLATEAKSDDVISIFSHTIPTGLKHGTVTVCIGKDSCEVTTLRIDGEYKDYRHPENVIFTSSITEDLTRRDFTINSIALSINENSLNNDSLNDDSLNDDSLNDDSLNDDSLNEDSVNKNYLEFFDPYGGVNDISNNLIKAVGNSIERFTEDPLRMLRAIRFRAQLGFSIDENTLNGIKSCANLIKHISWKKSYFLKIQI